jgi:predicted nucleic acid-binding protein
LRTALDTNILSAVWSNEASARRIVECLTAAKRDGAVVLSAFAYSESLAHPHATAKFVQDFLHTSGIKVEYAFPQELWSIAGERFAQYADRRRIATSNLPRRILADFLLGAHALVGADRLMTLDAAFYERNFPELRLYPIA